MGEKVYQPHGCFLGTPFPVCRPGTPGRSSGRGSQPGCLPGCLLTRGGQARTSPSPEGLHIPPQTGTLRRRQPVACPGLWPCLGSASHLQPSHHGQGGEVLTSHSRSWDPRATPGPHTLFPQPSMGVRLPWPLENVLAQLCFISEQWKLNEKCHRGHFIVEGFM